MHDSRCRRICLINQTLIDQKLNGVLNGVLNGLLNTRRTLWNLLKGVMLFPSTLQDRYRCPPFSFRWIELGTFPRIKKSVFLDRPLSIRAHSRQTLAYGSRSEMQPMIKRRKWCAPRAFVEVGK